MINHERECNERERIRQDIQNSLESGERVLGTGDPYSALCSLGAAIFFLEDRDRADLPKEFHPLQDEFKRISQKVYQMAIEADRENIRKWEERGKDASRWYDAVYIHASKLGVPIPDDVIEFKKRECQKRLEDARRGIEEEEYKGEGEYKGCYNYVDICLDTALGLAAEAGVIQDETQIHDDLDHILIKMKFNLVRTYLNRAGILVPGKPEEKDELKKLLEQYLH